LDIVLPCYNPSADWGDKILQALTKIRTELPLVDLNLILVNDGSEKALEVHILEQLERVVALHYINYSVNRGKGYALRMGVAASKADVCIYTDVDFPFEEHSLIEIYRKLHESSADVVLGVRDEQYYATVPRFRVAISKGLKFFIRMFLRLPVSDTQCGLKGFNLKAKKYFLSTTIERYLFDLEFVYTLARNTEVRTISHDVVLKGGVVFSKMSFRILLQESGSFLMLLIRHLKNKIWIF
jgi:glycosyltransferase involved in cell wall biosynthesis